MHEQNNAELVTKMHISFKYFFYVVFQSFDLFTYSFVEAGWLPKHIKGYLSIRFFWKFRERDEITSSGLGYKILASLAVVSRKLFLFAKQAG